MVVEVVNRDVLISRELAQKYYPGVSYESVRASSGRSVQAQRVRDATTNIQSSGRPLNIEEYKKEGVSPSTLNEFSLLPKQQVILSPGSIDYMEGRPVSRPDPSVQIFGGSVPSRIVSSQETAASSGVNYYDYERGASVPYIPPDSIDVSRSPAQQEARAQIFRERVPVNFADFVVGAGAFKQKETIESKFGPAAPIISFGSAIVPTIASTFAGPVINVLDPYGSSRSQIDISGMGTGVNFLGAVGEEAMRDPFKTAGSVATSVGIFEGLGLGFGKASPGFKEFVVSDYFAEDYSILAGFKGRPFYGQADITAELRPGLSTFPFKEFKTGIKSGKFLGFEITKPGKAPKLDYVDVPVFKGGLQATIKGPGTRAEMLASFEEFSPFLPSEGVENIPGIRFKGKGSDVFRPFGEPGEVKPVSAGARARAKLFMEGSKRGPKTKTKLSGRVDTGMGAIIEEPFSVPVGDVSFPFGGPVPPGGSFVRPTTDLVIPHSPGKTGSDFITASFSGVIPKQSQKQGQKRGHTQSQDSLLGLKTLRTSSFIDDVATDNKQVSSSLQGASFLFSQAQRQDQKQILGQDFAQETREGVKAPPPVGAPRGPPVPFWVPLPEGSSRPRPSGGSRPGYDVFSRVGGRVQRINKKPVSRVSALSIGGEFVDNSPSASFTIRKAKKPAQGPDLLSWGSRKFKFRPRRTKNALELVEKRKYRRDTPGERSGIRKRRSSGLFSFL